MSKKVLIFLAQGFEALEASVFTDVLGWADTVCHLAVEGVTAGLRSPVSCAWNFRVFPEKSILDVQPDEFSALVIPGGFGGAGYFEDAFAPKSLEIIQKFHLAEKQITGICVGALTLGKAGILEGRKAVTYHSEGGMWRAQLASMGACVVDEPVVCDGNIITCTSPAAAPEAAFMLLEMLVGREGRMLVEVQMGFRSVAKI